MTTAERAEAMIARANIRYATLKAKKHSRDLCYVAPEELPTISSDQVKALAFAVAQELEAMQAGKEQQ